MKTNGGFLVSQLKQIQGRVFENFHEANVNEFNGAQGRILYYGKKIPYQLLNYQKRDLLKLPLQACWTEWKNQSYQGNYDPVDRRQIRITLTEKHGN